MKDNDIVYAKYNTPLGDKIEYIDMIDTYN